MNSWPLAEDAILVTGRSEAGRILSSPSKRSGIRYVISIGSADEPPPAGLTFVTTRLRLLFEDEVSEARGGPTEEDVRRIIAFSARVDLATGRLLVHCQAGVSRSAAAATIVLAAQLGAGCERELAAFMRRRFPLCRPNARMLAVADDLLQREGALMEPWR